MHVLPVPQVKDRKIVGERMKAHVAAADTTPLLIFPEGTCVNNEYCVMFKRGAFDLDATVCPIAIKYNKIFVDAFWNSRRQSFTAHLVGLLHVVNTPPKQLGSSKCGCDITAQFCHERDTQRRHLGRHCRHHVRAYVLQLSMVY